MNGILEYFKTEMNEMSLNYFYVCPARAGHQCQRSVGILVILQNGFLAALAALCLPLSLHNLFHFWLHNLFLTK